MLISFSVANFRSFGDEVTLNLVASNKLADHEAHRVAIGETGKYALRAAVLYGANAAGKSNLIKAIGVAQQLIQGGRPSSVVPFRFQPEMAKKPSSFEFRFLIGDRVFIYGFDVIQNNFIAEWLAVMKGGEEVTIFERDSDGNAIINTAARKIFPEDSQTFSTLDALGALQLRNDQLFLNRAIELPASIQGPMLRAIIRWFTAELVLLPINYRTCDILDRLRNDSTFKAFCAGFLNAVGTGIGELFIDESEREGREHECKFLAEYGNQLPFNPFGCEGDSDIRLKPDNPTRVIVRQLLAYHASKSGKYALPFSEESDGTQSLLHLLPALSSPPEESRVIVIDELDRSLHPLICWEFIRFFSESCPGARRQLIVTTHEAHLLDHELLRRDEYWFVEKDSTQQSQLVSLSDFNIRRDLQVRKGYLAGRFGAIPMIGGMHDLEQLLECAAHEEPEDAAKASPA
ncbi:MAG TPA: ATP-binding protein [Pirellulales bacterium]|nr:ATP-binding protein [Pirellulales bacterium]